MLDKATLAATLTQIFSDAQAGSKSQAQVAQAIADALDTFVKSGLVTTATTCPAGAGTGTGAVT